jgi:hypothetical protein
MNKVLSKLINYNPVKSEITFKLLYVNEDIIKNLLELSNQEKLCKLEIKESRYKEKTKDSSRRRWFQLLSKILIDKGIPVSQDNLQAFHETMKESYFDVEKFEIEGKEIIVVPSINSIDDEVVRKACESIIDRYSKIGVDFSEVI